MNVNPAAYLVLLSDLRTASPAPSLTGVPAIPGKGHAFRLQPGKNIVGRMADPDITIVLPELTVSRRHAQVEYLSTGNWELEDLGSRNGTEVNAQKLQPHSLTPLNEGDRIRMAGVELTFSLQPDLKVDQPPSPEDLEKWLLGPYMNGDH